MILSKQAGWWRHIKAKCVGVAANPVDTNLSCVETSVDGEQLRLLDVRYEDKQIAAFGWKKPGDVANSTLVAPTWSPSGLLLTAGSGGREVKAFDMRYHEKQEPLSYDKTEHEGKVNWRH
ncbi:WD repeat-containing protein 61 [Artemisia annua]|uniref:WD repeat-containing protein 61 n=1 Tax=Artemisia annua TaxID=35608 RepID=A0A2U1KHQ3_ARTAN|nr:WD repeat-containing protein 61 [Artemisia annua]